MKKIIRLIKKRYRFFIGMLLGILVSASGVYAISEFNSNNVYYDNSNSDLVSKNVQDAIDELASREINGCPDFLICKEKTYDFTDLTLGDYINYTPPTTSFTTNSSNTGCPSNSSKYCYLASGTQTINPSELKLWRVISKNSNGTVDIVSEYVSTTNIYFYGSTGYKNFVKELRRLADAYKDNGTLTYSARPFGYSNQSDTVEVNSSSGDTGYEADFNLVKSILGTPIAYKVGSTSSAAYWMASRNYNSWGITKSDYFGRYVGNSATESGVVLGGRFYFDDGEGYRLSEGWPSSLRIILTLKSGLKYTSAGENTWNISA